MNRDLPEYNSEGKKLTYEQHQKKRKQYEEMMRQKQPKGTDAKKRYGVCELCGNTGFSLRCIKGGKLERTCKNPKCEDKRIF